MPAGPDLGCDLRDAASPRRRILRMGLAPKLALAFVGLVSLALLVSAGLNCWLGFREAEATAMRIQQEKARNAARRIEEFVIEIEEQLGWTTVPQWDALPVEQRRYDFVRLLRQVPAISELTEIDGSGKEELKVSRVDPDVVGSGVDDAARKRFVEAEANGVWFGPVYFRNMSEPYMTVAVAHAGRHSGVTVAEVDLRFVWDVIEGMRVGRTGYAYVVGGRGRLIAHPDRSLVLRDTDWSHLPQVAAALDSLRRHSAPPGAHTEAGPTGALVLTASAPVPQLGWAVFVELPLREALAPVYASLYRMAVLLAMGLLLAAGLGTLLARRMVVPIRRLQDGADRLGS
ncbi:MAG: cache domain-containing protein, partial [Stellaceae bacterium]